MANQLFAGFVYTGAGVAVVGATVDLLARNTTTPVLATTTTDASGYWAISHATEGRFDVRITNGTSISFLKYDDSIQIEGMEVAVLRVRNPADTFDYDIVPAAIVADRQLTLPLLTGTDTLVVEALAQTLTNKTLTSPVINTGITGTALATVQGIAKAWASWSPPDTTIDESLGVSSITDVGVGEFTVNFTTAFAAATYAFSMGFRPVADSQGLIMSGRGDATTVYSTTAFAIRCLNNVGAAVDFANCWASFFGAQ